MTASLVRVKLYNKDGSVDQRSIKEIKFPLVRSYRSNVEFERLIDQFSNFQDSNGKYLFTTDVDGLRSSRSQFIRSAIFYYVRNHTLFGKPLVLKVDKVDFVQDK